MGRKTEAVGVACGFAGLGAFLVTWAVSAVGDPGYAPFDNYLSDLGVGPMGWLFNAGVIAAGAGIIAFAALALRPVLGGDALALLAAVMLGVVGGLAMLVGIYDEDVPAAHGAASVALFVTLPLAGISIWAALRRGDPLGKTVTELTKGTAVLVLILLTFLLNLNDVVSPVAETLLVLALLPWMLVVLVELSVRLARRSPRAGAPSPAAPSPGATAPAPVTGRNADDVAPP